MYSGVSAVPDPDSSQLSYSSKVVPRGVEGGDILIALMVSSDPTSSPSKHGRSSVLIYKTKLILEVSEQSGLRLAFPFNKRLHNA